MGESSTLGEIAEQLPIKEAYNDLVHPAAAAVGQTLSYPFRAVNLLLSPFQKWLIKGEARMEEMSRLVSEELKDVPQEKLTEPDSYVVVPAMQAFSYSMDCDELKKMYAKLLAKAIHVDQKGNVHPSYVEIIKQMSPLDAKSLAFIYQQKSVPMCDIRWQKKSPILWAESPKCRSFCFGRDCYVHFFCVDEDGYSDQEITVSFENLERLSLIQTKEQARLDPKYYRDFNQSSLVSFFEEEAKSYPEYNEREIALIPGFSRITAFGRAFANVCLSDNLGDTE